MSFRKEYKYKLTTSDKILAKKRLDMLGMKVLFPSRLINSCYFDNQTMSLFKDSEDGVLPRKKVRFRWYGNETKYSKEEKISSVEGRFKTTREFAEIRSIEQLYNLSFLDKAYGLLKPVIHVLYSRDYYVLNSTRITFDTAIKYVSLKYKSPVIKIDADCVMEIKTAASCSDDYIQKIFPFSTARFSKYSRGMLLFEK